nr:hypothetical protein [Streptomyces sp. MH191]
MRATGGATECQVVVEGDDIDQERIESAAAHEFQVPEDVLVAVSLMPQGVPHSTGHLLDEFPDGVLRPYREAQGNDVRGHSRYVAQRGFTAQDGNAEDEVVLAGGAVYVYGVRGQCQARNARPQAARGGAEFRGCTGRDVERVAGQFAGGAGRFAAAESDRPGEAGQPFRPVLTVLCEVRGGPVLGVGVHEDGGRGEGFAGEGGAVPQRRVDGGDMGGDAGAREPVGDDVVDALVPEEEAVLDLEEGLGEQLTASQVHGPAQIRPHPFRGAGARVLGLAEVDGVERPVGGRGGVLAGRAVRVFLETQGETVDLGDGRAYGLLE